MGNASIFNQMIEQALLNTHTGFFAKVISVSNNSAKIQPLNMIKAVGGNPQVQAVLQSVPILQNVRKFKKTTVTISGQSVEMYKPTTIEKNDIVYCLCADRDITEAKRGNLALPALGHHSISDAVIIGVI